LNGVSVIVPAFNAARTLGETLASVGAQTRAADEIIVVDDGSTDATAEIAAGVPGVRLLRQKNHGFGAALTAGLAAARQPFIAFLDADDVWSPVCLETHERNFAAHSRLDASVGWFAEFVCPSVPAAEASRFQPRPAQTGWLAGATLLRHEALRHAGEFNPALRVGCWIDWMDRARRAGVRFEVTEQIVLRRRLHPGSLSTSAANRGGAAMIGAVRLAIARRRTPGT